MDTTRRPPSNAHRPASAALLPPEPRWNDGRPRRVGIEIEFADLELSQAADVVREVMGGRVTSPGSLCRQVEDTGWGAVKVELDSKPLQAMTEEAQRPSSTPLQTVTSELVVDIAKTVVPIEVIMPPLPFAEIPLVDEVVRRLGEAGARGTDASLIHAFGLHFNPEPPALDEDTLTRYLKAFMLLEDWLRDKEHIDIARRATPFVTAFPADYRRLVTAPDYRPEMAGLIDDYLASNPTRNRDLDMLPMFTEIDSERVRATVQEDTIVGRPTFHYRLPNSLVGKPGWSITDSWRRWLWVERLAGRPEQMERLGHLLAKHLDRWVPLSRTWIERMEQELAELAP